MKHLFERSGKFIPLAILLLLQTMPAFAGPGSSLADNIKGLHGVLDGLFEEMLPLCAKLIGIGKGIAGFAALFYIAVRVWRHLANAEAIDFFPLFRPFAIGFCVIKFTLVLALINGIMKPTVTGTAEMAENSNQAVAKLLEQKERALHDTDYWKMYVGASGKGDKDEWHRYTYTDKGEDGGMFGFTEDVRFAVEKAAYNFRNSIKEWMSVVLEVLFQAAALCINTLRTFQLIVLAILGPLVFALSVFDGFQHTLTVWLARYINIFLWLPVANIFGSIIGKIQEKMIELDISQIETTGYTTFFTGADVAYLIFLIIGIIGYWTVPSVANYIVNAAGSGALQQKVTNMFNSRLQSGYNRAERSTGQALEQLKGGASMTADALGNAAGRMAGNMADTGQSSGYFQDKLKGDH